jgi:hypothetical protein
VQAAETQTRLIFDLGWAVGKRTTPSAQSGVHPSFVRRGACVEFLLTIERKKGSFCFL